MEPLKRRKLLVAGIGIASVSYVLVACGKSGVTGGNLPAPPPTETPVAGNLVAAPTPDAAPPAPTPSAPEPTPVSGNLVAPPPHDTAMPKAADAGATKRPNK